MALTPAQVATLHTELATDPTQQGYAALLPDCPGSVVDKLNAVGALTCVQSRYVTALTVLSLIPDGAAILDALQAAAAQVSAVKWAMFFMTNGSQGVDAGDPTTIALLNALVPGVLTSAQNIELQGLALLPCSRAQQLGLPPIQVLDVMGAA